jgi:hypothetical protein
LNPNNDLIPNIQEIQGRVLEEGEIAEIEQWKRGQKLRGVVNSEEWQILLDTLQRYADSSVETLLGLPPGDPSVPTAHAAASALVQQRRLFEEDVNAAVQASYEMPEALKSTLRGVQ